MLLLRPFLLYAPRIMLAIKPRGCPWFVTEHTNTHVLPCTDLMTAVLQQPPALLVQMEALKSLLLHAGSVSASGRLTLWRALYGATFRWKTL